MDKTSGPRRSGRQTIPSVKFRDFVPIPQLTTDESEDSDATMSSHGPQTSVKLATKVSALEAAMNSYRQLQCVNTEVPPLSENSTLDEQLLGAGNGTQISTGQREKPQAIITLHAMPESAASREKEGFIPRAQDTAFPVVGQNVENTLLGPPVAKAADENIETSPIQGQPAFEERQALATSDQFGILTSTSQAYAYTPPAVPLLDAPEQHYQPTLAGQIVVSKPASVSVSTAIGVNGRPTMGQASSSTGNAQQRRQNVYQNMAPRPELMPTFRLPFPFYTPNEHGVHDNTQILLNAIRQMRDESQQQYREITQRLDAIEQLIQREISSEFPEKPDCLPLKTVEDLQEFETVGAEMFSRVVSYLGSMTRGGINETGNIVLKMAITNSLAPSLTWQGGEPGTTKLDGTRFAKALYAAVAKNDSFKKPTRREFLDVMTAALKAAKQRNRRLTRPRLQTTYGDENVPPPV